MIPDSNTSRYALPGRFTPDPPGSGPRSPIDLAAALRVCAAELDDDGRRTGMTLTLAARLMREASGMLVVMASLVPEGRGRGEDVGGVGGGS